MNPTIGVDGDARRLGHDNFAGAVGSQLVGRDAHIRLTREELGLGTIHLEVGHVGQSFGHVGPLAEDESSVLVEAHEPLYVQAHRPLRRQRLEQGQIDLTGDDRGDHVHPRRQPIDIPRLKGAGERLQLADPPLHVGRIVDVLETRRHRRGNGMDSNTLLSQFIQERKVAGVHAGDDRCLDAQAGQRNTAIVDGAAGCIIADPIHHQPIPGKVAHHQDIGVRR